MFLVVCKIFLSGNKKEAPPAETSGAQRRDSYNKFFNIVLVFKENVAPRPNSGY